MYSLSAVFNHLMVAVNDPSRPSPRVDEGDKVREGDLGEGLPAEEPHEEGGNDEEVDVDGDGDGELPELDELEDGVEDGSIFRRFPSGTVPCVSVRFRFNEGTFLGDIIALCG